MVTNKYLNNIKLKIKVMSLAEEAKIIRKLEKGCVTDYGDNPIYEHRVVVVRNEARASHLARSFLNGKPYRKVETKRKPTREEEFRLYIVPRVKKIIKKYTYGSVEEEEISKWLEV